MKFQIEFNAQPKLGYMLLDPQPREGLPAYTGPIDDLPCDDGECTEIYAPQLLDYIPSKDLPSVLEKWSKKLRRNGVVQIGGTDSYALCNLHYKGRMDVVDFNNVLYSRAAISNAPAFIELAKYLDFSVVARYYESEINFLVKIQKRGSN